MHRIKYPSSALKKEIIKRIFMSSSPISSSLSEVHDHQTLDRTVKKPKLALTSNADECTKAISNPLTQMQKILKKKSSIRKPIVWIDCEMTGLNVYEDNIIEICCIITDGDLNIVDSKGYESTIYYPKEVLDSMNSWCINQHGKSGLTDKVLANPDQTLQKVQAELLEYIKHYVDEKGKAIMAGNTIHMDKFFMQREFPDIIDFLHYRLIDVSTIMEVGYRHNPELMRAFPKKVGNHTAKSDILESINQLKWYRDNYLKSEYETKEIIQKFKVNQEES